jgi:chromosome partitioning protein
MWTNGYDRLTTSLSRCDTTAHELTELPSIGIQEVDMITAIASQKGGTGKTSTALALASGLAYKGKRVLLIDADSQANASKVLLPNYQHIGKDETLYRTIIDMQPLPIHPTANPRLFIAPAHILLSDTDMQLTTARDHREARLKYQVDQVKGDYEQVIIDCPPALGWLTLNAFTAADEVIVIVSPGYFELDSIVQIQKTIAETKRYFNPGLELRGLLFTMSDPTVNTANSLAVLRKMYGDLLLPVIIPRNTDIRDAHFRKQDIYTYAPTSKGARAYARLVEELYP